MKSRSHWGAISTTTWDFLRVSRRRSDGALRCTGATLRCRYSPGRVVGLMPGNLFKVELADGEHFEGKPLS